MKILLFAYGYSRYGRSETLTAYKIASELRQLHDVTVVTKDPSDHESVISLPCQQDWSRLAFARPMKLPYWEFMFKAYQHIKNSGIRYDLIHHISPISLRYPNLLSRLNTPFIWGPVGGSIAYAPGFQSVFHQEPWFKKLRLLDKLRLHADPLLISTLNKSSAIIATTRAAADIVPERHLQKVHVVPEGIDLDECQRLEKRVASSPLEGRYIFTGGRMVPFKAFDMVIKAFAKAQMHHKGVRLVISGEGPEKERLQQMAAELALGDAVVFVGHLDRKQNLEAMAGALYCAFPSLKEAFGHVNLEAMALGKPLIATNWGGPKDIVQHGESGFLIDPVSPEHYVSRLADHMSALEADQSMRSRLGSGARDRVKAFSWRAVGERIDKIYQQCAVNGQTSLST